MQTSLQTTPLVSSVFQATWDTDPTPFENSFPFFFQWKIKKKKNVWSHKFWTSLKEVWGQNSPLHPDLIIKITSQSNWWEHRIYSSAEGQGCPFHRGGEGKCIRMFLGGKWSLRKLHCFWIALREFSQLACLLTLLGSSLTQPWSLATNHSLLVKVLLPPSLRSARSPTSNPGFHVDAHCQGCDP